MTRRLSMAGMLVVTVTAVIDAALAGPIEVTSVRHWSFANSTRIAIEITGEVHYRSDRVQNPDRIFFDFTGARPHIDGQRLFADEVGDNLLKRIRVAETAPGVTRVVLDLETAAEFTVSRLDNPSRLIIELRPAARSGARASAPKLADSSPGGEPAPTSVVRPEPEPMREPPPRAVPPPPVPLPDPPALNSETSRTSAARMAAKVAAPLVILPSPTTAAPPAPPSDSEEAAASEPTNLSVRAVPKAAHASSDGQRSLTRALGLKINRVVIDPGHGGTDEGTVGRHGLMEKELVLDVAKRLGKLIEERMGSEVIYTRSDDTFIPLHARTEIANQKKADLFLSIHANSSPHPKVGGIEVYYLNFTRSSDALDLAARENASSEKSVYELRDLIQMITLHDKSEESREFASKVQATLQTFETRYNAAAKNRGVKKAPFVVLIGASMPSILAEVGFLSNTREEQLLKRPDHRQKLAEALYQGVTRYAQSLSHFQVAQRASSQ
jgi:N-acetylmuramoyl-L-alanine amidase